METISLGFVKRHQNHLVKFPTFFEFLERCILYVGFVPLREINDSFRQMRSVHFVTPLTAELELFQLADGKSGLSCNSWNSESIRYEVSSSTTSDLNNRPPGNLRNMLMLSTVNEVVLRHSCHILKLYAKQSILIYDIIKLLSSFSLTWESFPVFQKDFETD